MVHEYYIIRSLKCRFIASNRVSDETNKCYNIKFNIWINSTTTILKSNLLQNSYRKQQTVVNFNIAISYILSDKM